MIEARTIFYIKSFNIIGGVEQWMYYIAKHYGKTKDFIVLYRDGDRGQIERLARKCKVMIYNGEKVKCENAIFCYGFDIINNIEATNYYHFIHGNMEAVRKIYPTMDMLPAPQVTKQYSVSKITRDGYKKIYNVDTEVFYNIVDIEKIPKAPRAEENPRKLKLITASRLRDAIKGFDYMEIIAHKLQEENIPYEWLCFSDKPDKEINGNFTFLKPNLDITPYIANSDYLVQTSRDESYGYSIVESLMLDVPVIVMNIPVLEELGIKDKVHGYILDFDMSNLNVKDIYENIPIIKDYKPPMDFDKWEDILGEDTENFECNEEEVQKLINERWIALQRIRDDLGVKYGGEEIFIESSARIRQLLDHNLIVRKQ